MMVTFVIGQNRSATVPMGNCPGSICEAPPASKNSGFDPFDPVDLY